MKIFGDRGSSRVEVLELALADPEDRKHEIDTLNELAWEFRVNQVERSFELSRKAEELLQTGKFQKRYYVEGLAYSLTIQAFLETYLGQLDSAVSKCLQALALLHDLNSQVEVKVWFVLGWNSYFLGNYPAALENGMKALGLARQFGDRLHEAWALDALASFHGITGDFETAAPLHTQALGLFREMNESLGEMRTLNNLAVTLGEMKEYEDALSAIHQSLDLARIHGLEIDVLNNSCTLADILINMGRLDDAEDVLQKSASEYIGDMSIAHTYLLERHGHVRLLRNDPTGAETFARRALELAQKLEQRAEEALCHNTLSEIYELLGEHAKALEHYKNFHKITDALQGEKSAKRLAVLKITYQVEAARRDAEIYRLEASTLQRKVDEQQQIQSILELQTTIDPLTDVYNRRYFDDRFAKEYSRHSRSGAELSLLILDVDYFKNYNDTYGHVRGDECLQKIASIIRDSISRPTDVAARYGGEEFICLLPETSHNGVIKVAENIRLGVMDLGIPHVSSNSAEVVTVSIGVVTARCFKDEPETALIIKADEQLYKAKSLGRNRVEASRSNVSGE